MSPHSFFLSLLAFGVLLTYIPFLGRGKTPQGLARSQALTVAGGLFVLLYLTSLPSGFLQFIFMFLLIRMLAQSVLSSIGYGNPLIGLNRLVTFHTLLQARAQINKPRPTISAPKAFYQLVLDSSGKNHLYLCNENNWKAAVASNYKLVSFLIYTTQPGLRDGPFVELARLILSVYIRHLETIRDYIPTESLQGDELQRAMHRLGQSTDWFHPERWPDPSPATTVALQEILLSIPETSLSVIGEEIDEHYDNVYSGIFR